MNECHTKTRSRYQRLQLIRVEICSFVTGLFGVTGCVGARTQPEDHPFSSPFHSAGLTISIKTFDPSRCSLLQIHISSLRHEKKEVKGTDFTLH